MYSINSTKPGTSSNPASESTLQNLEQAVILPLNPLYKNLEKAVTLLLNPLYKNPHNNVDNCDGEALKWQLCSCLKNGLTRVKW